MDNTFDKMFYSHGKFIGGVDEVGVSDIAGPVVAACVVLPHIDIHKTDLKLFEVDDSKKIPEQYRKKYAEIIWQTAIAIGIGSVSPTEFDYFGKMGSVKLAMMRSVLGCKSISTTNKFLPDYLLLDGAMGFRSPVPFKKIVDGDTKSLSIASASVIAKVYRDREMELLHEKYPHYDWVNNKGYPCKNQFDGMDEHGIVLGVHRISCWPISSKTKVSDDGVDWTARRKLWFIKTQSRLT